MGRRSAIATVLGMLLVVSLEARAQPATTSGEALFSLVNRAGTFLITDGLFSLITSETATFPVSASASGFVWRFDRGLGVLARRTQSFGPMFAQRPLTVGSRKLNLGLSFQRTSFNSVDGLPLDAIRARGVPGFDDSSLLSLQVESNQVVASATYGLTDRVEVGLTVPFGRTRVSGTHTCDCFGSVFASSEDASSSGVGDIDLQTKVELPSIPALSLATSIGVRLPTGDKAALLGTGETQVKMLFIGEVSQRTIAPHFNVGYTFGGQGFAQFSGGAISLPRYLEGVHPSPEFDYTVGADAVVTPRITIAGDVIGRLLKKSVRIYMLTGEGFSEPAESDSAVNLVLGAVTAKVNIGATWLVTATVLFPLNSNGLKPSVTPVLGFERAF